MVRTVKISDNLQVMSLSIAEEMLKMAENAFKHSKRLKVALSGGSTPLQLFSVLGSRYSASEVWNAVDFFWSDERCVPPDSPESNFGAARELFLSKAGVPEENINRIIGENDPEEEAERYSKLIMNKIIARSGFPVFDVIFLGLGEDGHTASIFPGDEKVITSDKICEVAQHPVSGQKRITLTLPVINNAYRVIFMVTGKSKAGIVAEILGDTGCTQYPAGLVKPLNGQLFWHLDSASASFLNQLA